MYVITGPAGEVSTHRVTVQQLNAFQEVMRELRDRTEEIVLEVVQARGEDLDVADIRRTAIELLWSRNL